MNRHWGLGFFPSFLGKRMFIHFNFNYFQVGEFWNAPGNNCTTYTCEKYEDQYIKVILQKTCPPFNADECDAVSALGPGLLVENAAVANISARRIMTSKENT